MGEDFFNEKIFPSNYRVDFVSGSIFWCLHISDQSLDGFSGYKSDTRCGYYCCISNYFVSVATVMLSKRQEQKVEIAAQLRQKKVPVYEKIIEFIFLITFAAKLGKRAPTESETIQFFADTTRDLVIWGSHDMVKAFGDFREAMMSIPSHGDSSHILASVEDLLFAVRKDLGHNSRTKRGDILRLYINDLPDYFSKV